MSCHSFVAIAVALMSAGLATACSTPTSSASPPSSTASTASTAPPAASASSVPMAGRPYTAKQLFELQITPSAIAGDTSHLYVAEVALGARPANTLSKVVLVSPNGGTPAPVPGPDTPAGVSINGLTIFADALYLSEASNGSTRDNGIYRLVSGTATPIAGGPGAPA